MVVIFTANVNIFIIITNLNKDLFSTLANMAALAQLGERQTEDLKAPCSIHGGGISFSLRQLFICHKLCSIVIHICMLSAENVSLMRLSYFTQPIKSKLSMGIILKPHGRLHFNAYTCKLRREW